MDSQRWQQIKVLYTAMLERPEREWSSFLAAECGVDASLRAEVESLLAARAEADARLEPPTPGGSFATPGRAPDAMIGRRIGSYTLVRVLGYGGMGTVYEAEQESPRRRVALKIVRALGPLDNNVARLFRREVQALALLTHPNIAALYDTGETPDGCHYFAMELIDGLALNAHVNASGLSLGQRLDLFGSICDAVAYAHRRGVIHRDIKPSNILVTAACVPKLLDFGLARLGATDLSLATIATEAGRIQGTLTYMSPEQTQGHADEIDTRSDVYSLGVLLYELLTGQVPYDVRGEPLPKALRMICEEPPPRPSAAQRGLSGDLDTIILKALEKEPQQRYQSVGELGEDIRRFQCNLPILARPHSTIYHIRKILSRHKLPFAFATVLLAGLIAFSVTVTIQRNIARQARDEATQRLWESYLSRARVSRLTGAAGQRVNALDAIAKAVAIRPTVELRNEALSAMTLMDVEFERMLCDGKSYDRVALSDDLSLYAFSDDQGVITVREVADERTVSVLSGSGRRVHFMKISPDGRYLAATDQDGPAIFLYDIERSARIWELWGDIFWRAFAFSPDSQRIATGHPDKRVRVFSIPLGEELLAFFRENDPYHLAFSPDGRRLAIAGGSDGPTVTIWDFELETFSRTFHTTRSVDMPTWSSDGRWLAAGSHDYNVYVWDVQADRLHRTFHGHTTAGIETRFDPANSVLMSSDWDRTTRFWDLESSRQLLVAPYCGVVFDPSGLRVGFSCESQSGNVLGLWRVAPPKECRRLSGEWTLPVARSARVSHDDTLLSIATEDGARLFHLPSGAEAAVLAIGNTRSVEWTPSGELVTSGDRGLLKWTRRITSDAIVTLGPPTTIVREPCASAAIDAAG